MSLVSLLVALILIGLVWWAIKTIGAAFAIPQQIITVVLVIFVVFVVIWLLQSLGALGGGPILRVN